MHKIKQKILNQVFDHQLTEQKSCIKILNYRVDSLSLKSQSSFAGDNNALELLKTIQITVSSLQSEVSEIRQLCSSLKMENDALKCELKKMQQNKDDPVHKEDKTLEKEVTKDIGLYPLLPMDLKTNDKTSGTLYPCLEKELDCPDPPHSEPAQSNCKPEDILGSQLHKRKLKTTCRICASSTDCVQIDNEMEVLLFRGFDIKTEEDDSEKHPTSLCKNCGQLLIKLKTVHHSKTDSFVQAMTVANLWPKQFQFKQHHEKCEICY